MARTVCLRALSWLPVLGLACGAPADDDDPVVAEPVVATLGPEGGSVEARDAAGATLRVTVPEGALPAPIDITLLPLPPEGDTARFRVTPAGLVPRALLEIAYVPAGALPDAAALFWSDDEGAVAIGGAVEDGALVADVPTLGFLPGPSSAALRPVADTSPSTTVAVRPLSCTERVAAFEVSLQTTAARGDADAIAREGTELEALRARCAPEEIARVEKVVCDRYLEVVDDSSDAPVDTEAEFREVIGRLLRAMTAVEKVDGVCDTSAFEPTIEDRFARFFRAVEAEYARTPFTNDLEAHLDRFDALMRYDVVCLMTGVSDKACQRLRGSLFPGVLDRLRAAAWADCRATTNPSAPAGLLELRGESAQLSDATDPYQRFGRFTYADLEGDVAHCASTLDVRVYDDAATVPVEVEAARLTLAATDAVGSRPGTPSILVPADGSLTFQGDVPAPPCSVAGAEDGELVALVNGRVLSRATRTGRLFDVDLRPLEVTMEAALQAAGLGDTGTFDLVIQRDDGSCPTYDWPFELYRVRVSVGERLVSATLLTGHPNYGATVFREVIVTDVDCDAEEVTRAVAELTPSADAPFPTSVQVGGSRTGFRYDGLGRVVAEVSTELPAAVSDVCTGGGVDTNPSSFSAVQYVILAPSTSVSLTLKDHAVPGSTNAFVFADRAALDGNLPPRQLEALDDRTVTVTVAPPEIVFLEAVASISQEAPVTVVDAPAWEASATVTPATP